MGNPFSSLQRYDRNEFDFPQNKIEGDDNSEMHPSQFEEEEEEEEEEDDFEDQENFEPTDSIFDTISFKNVEIVKQNAISNSFRSMESIDDISSVSTGLGSSPSTPHRTTRQRSRTVSNASSQPIPQQIQTARSPRTPHSSSKRRSVFFSYNSPAPPQSHSNSPSVIASPTIETVITELHTKILIVGEPGSGKSSLRKYYTDGYSVSSSNENYKPTIGVEYGQKTISLYQELFLNDKSLLQIGGAVTQEALENLFLKLQFWDLGGKESFLLTNFYYKNAHAALFVFDLTHGISALKKSISLWKNDLDSKIPNASQMPCILLGNKCDLVNKQTKEYETMQKEIDLFCKQFQFTRYFEISLKTQQNLDRAMQVLLKSIYETHFQTSFQTDNSTDTVNNNNIEEVMHWNVIFRTEEYSKLAGNLLFFKKQNKLQFENIPQGYFDKKVCQVFLFEPVTLHVRYDPIFGTVQLKHPQQKIYFKFLQTNHLLQFISELNAICQNDTFFANSIQYSKQVLKLYKYYCVKQSINKDVNILQALQSLSDSSVLSLSKLFVKQPLHVIPVLQSIQWNPWIETLQLQQNMLTNAQMQSLMRCLANNSSIKSLYLDGNVLHKSMISSLTQYLLSSHGKLQLLSLKQCQLSDSLVMPLLASLQCNKRLQELDLSANAQIKMKTIIKICDLELIKDSHIKLINLSKTSIDMDAAKQMLEKEYSKFGNKSKLMIDIGILIQNTFMPLESEDESETVNHTSLIPKLKPLQTKIEIVNKNSFLKIEKLSQTNDTQVWKSKFINSDEWICCKEYTFFQFNYEQLSAIKQLLYHYESIIHPLLVPFYAICFDYKEHKCSILYPYHQYSLFDLLHKRQMYDSIAPFSMQQKLQLLKEVSSALCFLYSRGQSHFGVKSSNIMVDLSTTSGECKVFVADYGFNKNSRLIEKLLCAGVRQLPANGIYYVAPEKIKNMRMNSELVDVYSFAILMHEVYFEEIPFEKTNLFEKPTQLLHEVAFNHARPLIPKEDYKKHTEYFQLMERCWHRDKEERLSFQRIEQELERLIEKYKTE